MHRIEELLGVTELQQWYSIPTTEVRRLKEGRKILRIFKLAECLRVRDPISSLISKIAYPDHQWIQGNFLIAPTSTWKSAKQTREYLQSLEPLLHINDWTDWYYISRSQLEQVGASGMLTAFSRLSNACLFAFPEIPWSLSKFSVTQKRSAQR